MRISRCVATLVVAAVAALPIGAAIKAMNLEEVMSITDDAFVGKIIAKDTVVIDHPWEGAVYTKLTIQGESLRNGLSQVKEVVFHGSHDPSDDYLTSEMPELKDTRVGGQVMVLSQTSKEHGGQNVVYSLAGAYRIESGFGEPVVIGKGDGFAFPKNAKLSAVREDVRTTHEALAKKALKSLPGQDK
ncbi:MAG: hypothetical protein ACI9EF_000064 [Pseudohongiellaceae bacterium]|jgi:hypothetical protein